MTIVSALKEFFSPLWVIDRRKMTKTKVLMVIALLVLSVSNIAIIAKALATRTVYEQSFNEILTAKLIEEGIKTSDPNSPGIKAYISSVIKRNAMLELENSLLKKKLERLTGQSEEPLMNPVEKRKDSLNDPPNYTPGHRRDSPYMITGM